MISFDPKNPWLTPFTPKVMGGLREMISQYSDGRTNILNPPAQPTRSKGTYQYLSTAFP